jgi:arylsulfatase A-like enzyme
MNRRQFLSAATGAALAPAILRGQRRKPNLVFLMSDDMGYADLGCFGSRDIRTPHIDRLAAEGVRFTDCYSNGPVCTPTRVGLMTGRYQQRFGKALEWALVPVNNNRTGLSPKDSILASSLKAQGYRTGIFGKWHCGSLPQFRPNQHGFDESFGILRGNADMYSHQYRDGSNDLSENGQDTRAEGYLTEILAERSVSFIRRHHQQPFFLYLPFNAVHWPFQGPDRPDLVRNADTWTDGDRNDYRAMMHSMDAAVGAVLEELRRQRVDDNTLVIFTNDNGGERLSSNAPLFHSKATLWEGGIRVPGIARWPGRIPAGSVTGQATITMDFTASMLAAAGATPAGVTLDGMDVMPMAAGEKPVVERTLCWRIQRADRRQVAVRRGNWKYLREPAGIPELLFDLSRDPGERENLSYQHPAVLAELRQAADAWQKSVDADAAKAPPEANNPAN